MRAFIAREIAVIERQVAILQQQVAALTETPAEFLGYGACGSRVKNIQMFLNRNDFILATTGPGSTGQETTFFGPLTQKATQKFQSTYGIPASGIIDTRTHILIDSIDPNVLSEKTVEHCVTPKSVQKDTAEPKKDDDDKNSQDDEQSTSGNFFTNLIQKIFEFFRNLFQRDAYLNETE